MNDLGPDETHEVIVGQTHQLRVGARVEGDLLGGGGDLLGGEAWECEMIKYLTPSLSKNRLSLSTGILTSRWLKLPE